MARNLLLASWLESPQARDLSCASGFWLRTASMREATASSPRESSIGSSLSALLHLRRRAYARASRAGCGLLTDLARKHPLEWSLTMPTACIKA